MREEQRYHGSRRLLAGPSLITKTIEPDGTSPVFLQQDPTARGTKSAALQNDQFGLSSHDLPYSLGKHKRWIIPDMIANNIASLQRGDIDMRVSASLHTLHRHKPPRVTRTLINELEDGVIHSGDARLQAAVNKTNEYHDVVDGSQVHKYSNRGARLKTLTSSPNPKRKRGEKHRREHKEEVPEVAHDEYRNPIHIRYSVIDCVTPSKHAFATGKRMATGTEGVTKGRKSNVQRRRAVSIENEDDYEEDEEEVEETEDAPTGTPGKAYDIAQFIVSKDRKDKSATSTLRDWEEVDLDDEELDEELSEQLTLDEPSSSESEAESSEALAEPETSSTTPKPATKQPRKGKKQQRLQKNEPEKEQLMKLARDVEEYRNVFPFPARAFGTLLAVYPPAMLVHRKNSQKALGQQLNQCVIVKKEHGGTRTYNVEKCFLCPSSHRERRLMQLNISALEAEPRLAHPPEVKIPELCKVCVEASEDWFALACGHVFCLPCWQRHCHEEYNKGVAKIKCMKPSCQQFLSFWTCRALLSTEWAVLYSKRFLERPNRFSFAIRCPDCGMISQKRRGTTGMLCQCGTVVCTACQQRDHRPLSCSLYAEYIKLSKDGMRSLATSMPVHMVDQLTQCPTCSLIVQKEEGCDWMVCCRCHTGFCFKCGSPNYSHNTCVQQPNSEMYLVDHMEPSKGLSEKEAVKSLESRSPFTEIRKQIVQRLATIPEPMRQRAQDLADTAIRVLEFTMIDEMMRKRTSAEVNRPVVRQLYTAFYRFINGDDDVERIRHKCKNLRRAIDAVQG